MKRPKHIIVLCVDALRFDCIGVERDRILLRKYGVDTLVHTPTIDGITREGTRFTQAVSAANITVPSLASVMTGLFTPRHGVRQLFKNRLPEGAVTLAEVLKDAGYLTIEGDEHKALPLLGITSRGMDHTFRTSDTALWECIRSHAGRDVFLFLHVMDVHDPYLYGEHEITPDYNADYRDAFRRLSEAESSGPPRDEFPHTLAYLSLVQSMFDRGDIPGIFREYVHGVNKFDRGRLPWMLERLRESGLFDDSLFILMSDHGEGPGKTTFNHCIELYDGVVRVPLIMRYPGRIPENAAIDVQVRSVDLFPTVAAFAGIPPDDLRLPYDLDGRDLGPLLRGDARETRDAFFEIWQHSGDGEGLLSAIRQSWESEEVREFEAEWRPYQKGLRRPPYKAIVQGSAPPEAGLCGRSDEEFVRHAYRSVLRRKEDPEGLRHHLALLQSGRATRDSIIEGLRASEEYTSINQLYRLDEDPHENRNLLAGPVNPEHRAAFSVMEHAMEAVENCPPFPRTDGAALERDEEQKDMEHHLKALGYL